MKQQNPQNEKVRNLIHRMRKVGWNPLEIKWNIDKTVHIVFQKEQYRVPENRSIFTVYKTGEAVSGIGGNCKYIHSITIGKPWPQVSYKKALKNEKES